MAKTAKHDAETVVDTIEQMTSDIGARFGDVIANQPVKSLLIALAVGFVVGKLVL
jgi:ElaB/YqjD/DUF883 family membrane-anchored ribosome-binding protein